MADKTLMFYINSLERGGAERVIAQLADRFSADGYRCVLVCSYAAEDEFPLSPTVERLTMEREKSAAGRLRKNIRRISALRFYIRQVRPDALIAFLPEPSFRAVIAASGTGVPVIVSVRNDPDREYGGRLGHFVGRHLLPHAEGCVFQTEQAKAWFPEELQRKSAVILNQVSPAFFDRRFAGERHGIVSVGRLETQKNQALLLRAFARIADRTDEDIRLYGEGELEKTLRALASELGVAERVHFMGNSSRVADDIAGAQVFVLASDYEGMPNALLEAMALSLPCIATDCPCGGPAAVIRDGENGYLVGVGDEAALADKLLRLLSDRALADRLGAAAGRTAEQFRPERVFGVWKAYIEAVIGGGQT